MYYYYYYPCDCLFWLNHHVLPEKSQAWLLPVKNPNPTLPPVAFCSYQALLLESLSVVTGNSCLVSPPPLPALPYHSLQKKRISTGNQSQKNLHGAWRVLHRAGCVEFHVGIGRVCLIGGASGEAGVQAGAQGSVSEFLNTLGVGAANCRNGSLHKLPDYTPQDRGVAPQGLTFWWPLQDGKILLSARFWDL